VTRNDESRPTGKSGGAATTVDGESTSRLHPVSDLPHARANAGPPVPGRHMWAYTVLSCPRCGGMHQHRAGEPGRIVRSCPTTGRLYRLSPIKRWREARRG
jgi:hypothetical protein